MGLHPKKDRGGFGTRDLPYGRSRALPLGQKTLDMLDLPILQKAPRSRMRDQKEAEATKWPAEKPAKRATKPATEEVGYQVGYQGSGLPK